jgi:hypothetical protein
MLLGNRLSIIGLDSATRRPASEVAGVVLDALENARVHALVVVEPHSAMFESCAEAGGHGAQAG